MALNLNEAIITADLSLDGALILRLVAEIQMLRRESDLAELEKVRLSTELAYSEARADRLAVHNAELIAAVVAAQADGLFEMPVMASEKVFSEGNA